MRLERIVLHGFKSFADKIEFSFDCPVTAIVGPNGCGKSNIVDAVKWVLGEQSVKSLRSGHMSDVIFSGSSSRRGVGAAEVSLVISNPNGTGARVLAIDTDEVQISRKIYKSGESEYRINKKLCRLKDIRELFMDTGVGVRAYSIIEQGQVEQLLNATRTDRRVIFEEAAGISKYKAHKKEALRKLEYTEQNLLRLADILGEVGKQLRSVKLAAGKARNYLQYRERLRQLQVNYSLAEYGKNYTKAAGKKSEVGRLEEEFAAIAAEVGRNDALLGELGERIIETEGKLNRTDNSVVAVQGKIDQSLQRIEFLRSRISELRQRKGQARQRVKQLQEQEKVLGEDLARSRGQLTGSEKGVEEKRQSCEDLEKAIEQINAECTSLARQLEDEKSGIIDIVRRTAQLHNEVQSISVYRENLSSQKERLAGRAKEAGTELERLLTEQAQQKSRLGDIEKVLVELAEGLESKRKESEETDGQIETSGERLTESKEARSALSSELAVLTDMERRHEGVKAGVKGILEKRSAEEGFEHVEGIVAELVAAEVEYATAAEAALEGKTDAVITSERNRLMADKEALAELEGRVNFICMDEVEPFVDKGDFSKFEGVRGRLAEFVKTEEKYAPLAWKLLGKTIVVESLERAIEVSEATKAGYEFVTLEGEVLGSDGVIRVGPLGKATGLVSRKSRLRHLEETIENITSEIKVIEEQIERKVERKAHLGKLCQELRTAIYEANAEKTEVRSKLTVYEDNIKRLEAEQPLIAGEMGLLEEQISQSAEKEYESKQKLEELETVNKERTARIEELESRYSEEKVRGEELGRDLTDSKVALGQMGEQIKALQQAIASLENQIEANRAAAEEAQVEAANCSEQADESESDILRCESAVSELFVEKEKREAGAEALGQEIQELLAEQKRVEEVLRQKRAEQAEVETKRSELKIELSQLEVKNEDLVERVREELEMDLVKAYADYKDEEVDWEKVREEMVELRSKIERLGNVNVDAIAEQEGLEQRHEFLTGQVEDLNSSRRQLQQLISRLNKISRERFGETFEQIRGHFQQIFRKLFGGGKADILLEDDEDILEAGIEIIARPPGKETRSISLLSGGEKALTAIALLFAVFKTKPSPFCFLDEIDAALDEANNERFNTLLREFQKDSQFIVITHAKRTMSIADMLYGITMQVRGVSKKISVQFDQFEEVEETSAVA
ncbi:MAG: chromosome segregation protein SMC [Planctomycetota bacterium]|jgi:chromosome segregation protein